MYEITDSLKLHLKSLKGVQGIGFYYEDDKPHLVVRIYKRNYNNKNKNLIPDTYEGLPVEVKLIHKPNFLRLNFR